MKPNWLGLANLQGIFFHESVTSYVCYSNTDIKFYHILTLGHAVARLVEALR